MKFYVDQFKPFNLSKIIHNKLTAIYVNYFTREMQFFKSGIVNNEKNAAQLFEIEYGYKYRDESFYLNGIYYGCEEHFNKKSWRKFVKLKAFL
jgi:hypothetical protein